MTNQLRLQVWTAKQKGQRRYFMLVTSRVSCGLGVTIIGKLFMVTLLSASRAGSVLFEYRKTGWKYLQSFFSRFWYISRLIQKLRTITRVLKTVTIASLYSRERSRVAQNRNGYSLASRHGVKVINYLISNDWAYSLWHVRQSSVTIILRDFSGKRSLAGLFQC